MDKNSLVKKELVVAVILLFISVSVIPSTAAMVEKKFSMPTNYDGNTLYVGGGGPDNYTKIQDAIDNANIGDTVFVYSGYYTEEIEIYKSINLIGEHKDSTSIAGQDVYDHIDVVKIIADDVVIEGFTIKHSGKVDCGILIRSNNNQISFCNIIDNGHGILVIGQNNNFLHCFFHNNDFIALKISGMYNVISNCIFDKDEIELMITKNTIISDCEIFNAYIGIHFYVSDNNEIINCHIHDVVQGISVREGGFNYVIKDCIIENISLLGGINSDYMEDLQLINTTIANCSYYGVRISSYLANAVISGCRFINNELSGLSVGGLRNVEISNNHFEGNQQGLSLVNRNLFNFILQNNFINNEINIDPNPYGYFYYMINRFNNNYFDDWLGIGPYHVYGFLNWDFNPATKPHNLN